MACGCGCKVQRQRALANGLDTALHQHTTVLLCGLYVGVITTWLHWHDQRPSGRVARRTGTTSDQRATRCRCQMLKLELNQLDAIGLNPFWSFFIFSARLSDCVRCVMTCLKLIIMVYTTSNNINFSYQCCFLAAALTFWDILGDVGVFIDHEAMACTPNDPSP